MPICIFEDEQYLNFEPLIYARPVYDLICGMTTLKDKIIRAFPKEKVTLKCRPYLESFVKSENPKSKVNQLDKDDYLFINGRIIAPSNFKNIFKAKPNEDKVFVSNGVVVAAKLSRKKIEELKLAESGIIDTKVFADFPSVKVDIPIADFLWDLVYQIGKEIENEFLKL